MNLKQKVFGLLFLIIVSPILLFSWLLGASFSILAGSFQKGLEDTSKWLANVLSPMRK